MSTRTFRESSSRFRLLMSGAGSDSSGSPGTPARTC